MKKKTLKLLTIFSLIPLMAACGGKGNSSSDTGSSSGTSSNPNPTTNEPTISEPQPVEMTYDEAFAKVSSAAEQADEGVSGYRKKYTYTSNAYQALYMSLKLTNTETGEELDPANWDSWSYDDERLDYYTDKVFVNIRESFSGDGTSTPGANVENQYYDGFVQARYLDDTMIGVFEDANGVSEDDEGNPVPYQVSGLTAIWGQAYCDWWDMTYGKYSASYIGQNTMEKYDEDYFTCKVAPNANAVSAFAYYGDDYYENGVAPVVAVDAWEDYTTFSLEVSGDYGYTLGDLLYLDEDGNGYEGFVDAEVYEKIKVEARFDTATGGVVSYTLASDYFIKTNPNTGKDLAEPFSIQTQVYEYSDFSKNATYGGELKQVGNEFDVRYYDIFYKDAEHYWFFTYNQGVPCPYQVDLTATKLNKAMTDGFSWSDPARYNADGTISLNGAKAHTYVDADGANKSIKYSYTFSLDANGNLISSYVNENGETITETYYSSANFAALNA